MGVDCIQLRYGRI